MTPAILERVRANKILFYRDSKAAVPYKAMDCIRVYTDRGYIKIKDGLDLIRIARVSDIPITRGGMIACNIENCLAAVAALYGLRVSPDTIAAGLLSFTENKGRFHLFELNGFQIMLDYGHNPAGYTRVTEACRKLGYARLIGVIGMPGDRMDCSIQQAAHLSAEAFDRIYIKEDTDLRGRQEGEVAGLFYKTILQSGYPKEDVNIIENELDALKAAVGKAHSNDLIVVFYEKIEPLLSYLDSAGAKSVETQKNTGEALPAGKVINL